MVMTVVLASSLHGCAALPVAALAESIVASGAGAVVKTGTEYTFGGTAHRTLMVPISAVRAGVLEAFSRAGVEVLPHDDPNQFVGKLQHRTVKVKLSAFSDSLTGMTLSVKQTVLKDRATTSELLEQIEQVLAENPSFARRLQRVPTPGLAASPAY
jgi:hypothetical protein